MSGSKSIQFPAPTGPYKVSIKNNARWQGAPEVRLQISVGKLATEGQKLFALCEWAASRFPRTVLVVSDTLQRHNLKFAQNISEEEAHALSLQAGNDWLARNKSAISILNDVNILRWDNALLNPETDKALVSLHRLYRSSLRFRTALDATVSAFWARNIGANGLIAVKRSEFEVHSRAFLLEELAVFSWLCRRNGVDAYAGSWLEQIFAVLKEEGPQRDAFSRDWVQIDYTHNKAFSAFHQTAIAA